MCQNVLWQSGLQEDVLDFDAGNEAVIVRVCLLEQGVEPESLSGVDHPWYGLNTPWLGRCTGGLKS